MRRHAARWLGLAVAVAWVAVAPRAALAQFGFGAPGVPSSGAAATMTPSTSANPYMNPYMNPFMNPYMAPFTQANPQTAALYLFSAQSMAGGIGSGQLSGVRPGPATPRASDPAARPAEPRAVRTSDIPGGGAARYFGRSLRPTAGADRYYNRPDRYYSSRGR